METAVEPITPPSSLVALRTAAGALVVASTVLASAVATFDANVVKVAIPAIGRDLGTGGSALQWTLTSYLLVVAALLLLSGALADRFGRRRLLAVGLVVMLASSALCAIAPSVGALIAARIVQGIGGALVVPNSLALLNGSLRDADRARGIGLWAGLQTLATTVGPYAGGWLVDHSSWRAVFLLNVPLAVAALVTLRRIPATVGAASAPLSLDAEGAFLSVVGLGGVIYALTAGASSGWLSAPVLISGFCGVAAFVALVPFERRTSSPMLRRSLFSSRQFDAINVTTVFLYGALGAAGYLIILEMELQLGYSASAAGAALIPTSALFLVLAPLSGVLVPLVGSKRLMVSGILALAASFMWLSAVHRGVHYATAILPATLLWGLGIGLMVTPLTAAVLAAVDDDDLGEASAVNDAAARVGGVIVIALVPALIGATNGRSLDHALGHGYRPAMIVMGVLCVVAAVVAGVFATNDRDNPLGRN